MAEEKGRSNKTLKVMRCTMLHGCDTFVSYFVKMKVRIENQTKPKNRKFIIM